jgi:hypothetical protein
MLRLRGGMYLPPSSREDFHFLSSSEPLLLNITFECPQQPDGSMEISIPIDWSMLLEHKRNLLSDFVRQRVEEIKELYRILGEDS